jgi:hypothetical protein
MAHKRRLGRICSQTTNGIVAARPANQSHRPSIQCLACCGHSLFTTDPHAAGTYRSLMRVLNHNEDTMLESFLVTNSQEAQALNLIGTRLDLPVVRWQFGRKFSKHWDDLVYAQLRLLNAVFEYDEARQKVCFRKRRKVGHRLDDIAKTIRSGEAFADEGHDENLSDQDRRDRDILALFLRERAIPFVEFWRQAIVAIDHGIPLEIEAADIPIWFDERPE